MNKKNLTIIIVIIILALIGIWLWSRYSRKQAAPVIKIQNVQTIAPKSDATSAINSDLQNINTGNLDQEFQGIDKDLKSL